MSFFNIGTKTSSGSQVNITVDTELNSESKNPIANNAVTNGINEAKNNIFYNELINIPTDLIHFGTSITAVFPFILYRYNMINSYSIVTGTSDTLDNSKTYYNIAKFFNIPYIDFVYKEDYTDSSERSFYLINPITELESDKEYYVFNLDADEAGGNFEKVTNNSSIPTDNNGNKHTIFYERVGNIFEPWTLIHIYLISDYDLVNYFQYYSESFFTSFNGVVIPSSLTIPPGDYFFLIGDNHDCYLVGPQYEITYDTAATDADVTEVLS